jgi:RHS repeat-associated protein
MKTPNKPSSIVFTFAVIRQLLAGVLLLGSMIFSTAVFSAEPAEDNAQWVRCSGEWGVCTPPVPAQVRYGVDLEGQAYYVFQYTEGAINCTNSVFGNPLNVVKHCDYLLSSIADYDGDGVVDALDVYPNNIAEAHDSDSDGLGDNGDPFPNDANNNSGGNWLFCASEWGVCVPPVPAQVRYGVELNEQAYYVFQYTEGAINCTNRVFGNPLNVVKRCDYLLSSTTDYDGDGVVDALDVYPNNIAEAHDSDGDGFGDNSDPFPNDADNNSGGDWLFCAYEWGVCVPPVPALIRYGVENDGQYFYEYQYVTDTVDCRNNVFGNPINVYKRCDYILSSTTDYDGDGVVDALDVYPNNIAEAHDSDGDGFGDNSDPFPNDADNNSGGDWLFCAYEWGVCVPPVPALIRYGVENDGQYFYKYQYVTDTVDCRNNVFGNPINVFKRCDYMLSSIADYDGDGVVDSLDVYPNNTAEAYDSDGDGFGDNSDLFPNDGTNAENANWVLCAEEFGVCRLPLTTVVRYGADNIYTYAEHAENISCTNSVFGNPISVRKQCHYLLKASSDSDGDGVADNIDLFPGDPDEFEDSDNDNIGDSSDPFPNDPTNAADHASWLFCSNEWDNCEVPAKAIVRYGANNTYVYKSVTEQISCTNFNFGDPISGVVKTCDYWIIDTVPNPPEDTDGDGVADSVDAFPNDPLQSQDTDGNGVGDNTVISQAVSYTYNDNGQILTVDGPRTDVNDITAYTYDSDGNRNSISDAMGNATTLSNHNGRGQPQQITDANGTVTTLSYHVRGWLLSSSVQHPSSQIELASTTHYAYDNVGNITQVTLPEGYLLNQAQLNYHYDASNRLIGVSNREGERIDYALDKAGNRVSQTISNSASTVTYRMTQAYDELSRVMAIVGADSQTTQIDYDVNDNAVQTINPRYYVSQNQYDPLDRLTQTTDADNGTTQFTYDAQNRLTRVTDANGNSTIYVYNAFDHLVQQASPDTGVTRYAYDNAGNRIISVDSRGVVSRYQYDALNRLTQVSYPSAPEENITYTYDVSTYTHPNDNTLTLTINGKGRLFSIQDASGQQFYSYDHRGNVNSHVRVIGNEVTSPVYWTDYLYDLADNLVEIQMFSNTGGAEALDYAVDYRYDNLGRIASVDYTRDNTGQPSTPLVDNLTYLPFGGVTGINYANGVSSQHSYDQDYRLNQWQTHTDNATLIDRSYSYDANSNITQIDHLEEPLNTQDFGYDPLDRLDSHNNQTDTLAWVYDPVGNRLSENTDDYGYQLGSNILLDVQRTSETTSYILDERGNTTAISQGGSATSFSYNAANRPQSVHKDGMTTTYIYNALGQRTSKTQGGNTTHYIYTLQGQLMGEYTASGQALVEYLYLGNQPLAQLRGPSVYYYHNDHIGTPIAMTDESQNVVWQANYTAFGDAELAVAAVGNNLRFPGQYFDAETGLHYNYFRYYDPSTGRYLRSDPIGLAGGINTYGYVYQNPLKYIDPLGLDVIVTLYQGQGANIADHIGIGTTTGLNANQTYGAGPNSGEGIGFPSSVPGHVAIDGGVPLITITIPTTPEQDALINSYNTAAANNLNFQYDLLSNSCVDHVRGALNAGGIAIPTPVVGNGRSRRRSTLGQNTNLPVNLINSLRSLGAVINH